MGLGWGSDECRVGGGLMDVGVAIWMCGWRKVSQWLDERTDE